MSPSSQEQRIMIFTNPMYDFTAVDLFKYLYSKIEYEVGPGMTFRCMNRYEREASFIDGSRLWIRRSTESARGYSNTSIYIPIDSTWEMENNIMIPTLKGKDGAFYYDQHGRVFKHIEYFKLESDK